MGVAYTDAERALMLDNIAAQIDLARQRRAAPMPLALPPATRFDPRPPGFAMPDCGPFRAPAAEAPRAAGRRRRPSPMRRSRRSPAWIRTRRDQLRCGSPASISTASHALAPTLECIATLTPELAMQQAEAGRRAAGRAAPISARCTAFPGAARIIIDTAGITDRLGRGAVSPTACRTADATVVRRLAAAGAVMVAKTTVGALAYGDIWYGGRHAQPVEHRGRLERVERRLGSATAAGLVGFSLGTETLGSIVAPSLALRRHRAAARPSAGCRAPGRCRCAGRSTRSGRCAARSPTPRWCWPRINGRDPADPGQIGAPFGYDAGGAAGRAARRLLPGRFRRRRVPTRSTGRRWRRRAASASNLVAADPARTCPTTR